MFLSIIIPVYNGEKCITHCLDSIWSQGLDVNEYEVICVNDCSKDNTVGVVTTLQKEHPNLRLLSNQENLRAGGSRNYGVREAHGEYILFIDADDYFHPGALKKIFDYQQKYRLDILMCDFARETALRTNDRLIHNFKNRDIISGRDFFVSNGLPFGPCKYVFRKSLMINNNVFFEERVCCEDADWTHNLALYANKMQYQPILLSHVVINELSQTANEHRYLRPVTEKLFAGYRLYLLAEKYKEDVEVANHLKGVATVYYSQGIRYMTAVFADILGKKNAICCYIPKEALFPGQIKLVRRLPWLFAIISNMTAPIVKGLIIIKRKYAGR